jgi:CRP-like cAMP-binding protein
MITSNAILSRLSRDDLKLLKPHLEAVQLASGKRLERRNGKIEHVYFIERGFASVIAEADKRNVEVGLIGREGVAGLACVTGAENSPFETLVQLDGEALCMASASLRGCVRQSGALLEGLLRYTHLLLVQIASTAIANARGKVEERLARWLLMAHDRIDGDELALTHERLALMLGVRRPGVTEALKLLESKGLITTDRRAIIINDREGLKNNSLAYGAPEAEYRRLFG